ncbi:hypothetical protein [Plantactinospora endophytica]|uniref:Allene oxide cyclase barrel-like domain-containing protein n=1 Tax=Plantactinospora endophytica TaxID=673535 RepID=A0ABQ4DVI3_9ACTN|nr:hypothetical protein [Plantactinospora endophytica]GIG86455.1 hypothetical protein Pen02_13910 [Plantactinospora endophytica]
MARIFGRKTILLAVGALALTLVGGGIAVAGPTSRTDPDAVRVNGRMVQQPPVTQADIDMAKAALLKGDASVQASSAQLFAVVSANGGLIRHSQGVSATSLGVGLYQVVFTVPVANGAFLGTIGLTGSVGTSPSGFISVVGRTNLAQGVFVQTWNAANQPANRSFHLSVHLP